MIPETDNSRLARSLCILWW